MDPWGLKGKTAIITGGGNGIGRATAHFFAGLGVNVVIADVAEKDGNETEQQIKTAGNEATFIRADVSSESDMQRLAEETEQRYKRIDMLFANAAVQLSAPVHATEVDEWDRLHAVNLKGVFLSCKHVIPSMRRQKIGAIVIISSCHASITYPNCSAYAATKAGLVGFMRGVALDYASEGIRANCILPGSTDSRLLHNYINEADDPEARRRWLLDKIPLGTFVKPEAIGHAAAFLCSDYAAHITGTTLIVDGGQLAMG